MAEPNSTHHTWSAPSETVNASFELFTPPTITFDSSTQAFTIRRASEKVATTQTVVPEEETPFGLELIGIKRVPFRLQLVGYVGAEISPRGIFQNAITGETRTLGVGEIFSGLQLAVRSLELRRERGEIFRSAVVARVIDAQTGEELVLRSDEPRFEREPIAMLRETVSRAEHETPIGATLRVGDGEFRLARIDLEAATAELVKTSPRLVAPLVRTLSPVHADQAPR